MAEGLDINNLTFTLDSRRNLFHQLNLTVKPGEAVLLCGQSGSGKSVLSGVLNGYYPENGGTLRSGDIQINGQSITSLRVPERSKMVRTIFQNSRLSFSMQTLAEEMIFCLENNQTSPEKMDRIVREYAEHYHVTHLLHQPFDALSGGELQRAAFVCAQLVDASVYIFDEPFANLDNDSIAFFIDHIKKLQADQKVVLVIDHRIELWQWLDRWLLLDDAQGQLIDVTLDGYSETEKMQKLEAAGVYMPKLHSDTEKPSTYLNLVPQSDPVLALTHVKLMTKPHYKKKHFFSKTPKTIDTLISDATFSIYPGELDALVGPSGGGKTSLLMAILKQRDYEGSIVLDNHDTQSLKNDALFTRLGLVFQDPSLQFVHTKVRDEIALALPDEGAEEDTIRQILARFNLEEKIDTSPWLLSQGQQRRLAVLCMTLGKQQLLLVDEPTYGQDERHALEIMDALKELCDTGMACLFTSHDPRLVNEYASRQFQLKDRQIREVH